MSRRIKKVSERGRYKVKSLDVSIQKELYDEVVNQFGDSKKIKFQDDYIIKSNVLLFLHIFNKECYKQNKNNKRYNSNKFQAHLYTPILRKEFISNYNNYINFLIAFNYIEFLSNYSTDNGVSKLYGLSKRFHDSYRIKTTYQVFKDESIYKKYDYKNGLTKYEYDKHNEATKKFPHLVKFFNKKLTINSEDAKKNILKKYRIDINDIKSQEHNEGYQHTLKSIESFEKQIWKTSYIKESDRRLHTNLTNANKLLRKHLRYDCESLGEIDIKCSQPTFLLATINYLFFDKRGCELGKFVDSYFGKRNINKIKKHEISSQEFIDFKNNIMESDFYEEVGKHFDYELRNDKYYRLKNLKVNGEWKNVEVKADNKRDLIKTLMLEALFSKKETKVSDVKTVWAIYPSIFNLINDIKTMKEPTRGTYFSNFLQQLESYIFLDIIAKEFAEQNPDVPLYSIHDCLITTKSNVLKLNNFINDNLYKLLGLDKVKIDYKYY